MTTQPQPQTRPRRKAAAPQVTLSMRFSPEQHAALVAAAEARNLTATALMRRALDALLAKLGVAPPINTQSKSRPVPIKLWPHDLEALTAYIASGATVTDLAGAARAAMRVGLIHRGFMQLEPGQYPDLMGEGAPRTEPIDANVQHWSTRRTT